MAATNVSENRRFTEDAAFVRFSWDADGKLLHGDSEIVEKEFAYVIENDDGRQETVKLLVTFQPFGRFVRQPFQADPDSQRRFVSFPLF